MTFKKLINNRFFLDLQEVATDIGIFMLSLYALNILFSHSITVVIIFTTLVAIKKIFNFYIEIGEYTGGFITAEKLKYYLIFDSIFALTQILLFAFIKLYVMGY